MRPLMRGWAACAVALCIITLASCSTPQTGPTDAGDAALPTAIRSSNEIAEVTVSKRIEDDGTTISVAHVDRVFHPTTLGADLATASGVATEGETLYVEQEGTPETADPLPFLEVGGKYLLFLVGQKQPRYTVYMQDAGIYRIITPNFYAHLVMGSQGRMPTRLVPEDIMR